MANATKSSTITGRIPRSLAKRLRDASKATGQDKSELVRVALEQFFSNHSSSEINAAVAASRA